MNKKKFLLYGAGLAILAILVYIQFRHWSEFDWPTFWKEGRRLGQAPGIFHLLHAVALIYLAYVMRAIRWKIFLKPVRPEASWWKLISPTVVGFTGLALLGRPGEMIRPYLIARRLNLNFSSQLAIWVVERLFDLAAFTLIIVVAIFAPTKLRAFITADPHYVHWLPFLHSDKLVAPLHRVVGYGLTATVLFFLAGVILLNYRGAEIAKWIETRFSYLPEGLGSLIAERVRAFANELKLIHGISSLIQLSTVSVVMWCMIAVAYKEVTHAYGQPQLEISQTQVLLLMGSSMVGSIVQLPGVGGGSQIATIAALDGIFHVPKELAASCGITLWLVTFVAVVPLGLALAHRERLSLRALSQESQKKEHDLQSNPPQQLPPSHLPR